MNCSSVIGRRIGLRGMFGGVILPQSVASQLESLDCPIALSA